MNSYFLKRKARAIAVSSSMDGIGGLALPPLLTVMFSNYGFPGAMFAIAAVSAHLVIAGALFRPIKIAPQVAFKTNGEAKRNGVANGHTRLPEGYVHYARGRVISSCSLDDAAATSTLDLTKDTSLPQEKSATRTPIYKPKAQSGTGGYYECIEDYTPPPSEKFDNINNSITEPKSQKSVGVRYDCIEDYDAAFSETEDKDECLMNGKAGKHTQNGKKDVKLGTGVLATGRRVFRSYFDFSTMRQPKFLATAGVIGGMSVAMGTANLFLATYAKERGFTTAQIAILLSVRSGVFVLFKPMSGIAFDHRRLRRYRLEMFAMVGLFGGLCTVLAPFATNNLAVLLVWVINSFFVSWILAQEPVVVAETVSLPKFPSALGLARFIRGVFSLTGNLVAGKFQIQVQKMFIAIIHNINTRGRSCIRLLHQIALQYTTQLSTENYTLSTVKHVKEKQIIHIMAMGARNPSGFMGSISDQHVMLIQQTGARCKTFSRNFAHSHIDVLAQGCSISIGLTIETLQSRTKPTIWYSCGTSIDFKILKTTDMFI